MIVKIIFTGQLSKSTVKMDDYVYLHALDENQAKIIFEEWISRGTGVKGSLCFHPLLPYGTVKIKKIMIKEPESLEL